MTIADGNQVGIEYTLTLDDGEVADTNVGGEPLVFTQGEHQIIPGLEKALSGLEVGDTKTVQVAAGDAYGNVDPEGFQNIPVEQIPEEARTPGAILVASAEGGQQRRIRVHEVNDDHVVIDFNHPLAGRDLTFDVKILTIE